MATEHQTLEALGVLAREVLKHGPPVASRDDQRRSLAALMRLPRSSGSPRLFWPAAVCLLVAGLAFMVLCLLSS